MIDRKSGEVLDVPVVRKPWERYRVQTACPGKSLVHEAHKEGCDINKIVRSYMKTGSLPPSKGPGQYLDVSGMKGDKFELINKSRETIAKAEENGRKIAAARKESAKAEAAAKPKAEAADPAAPAVPAAGAPAPKTEAK